MGWSGSYVLAAGEQAVLDRLGEADEEDSYVAPTAPAIRWFAASFDDEDLFWEREEVLDDLVRATGLPVLVGLCLDSDFLGLVGLAPDGARWSGAVDLAAAREYRREGLEEGYDVVVPEFDETAAAAAGCVAWARAAGLMPDEQRLRLLFAPREWEQPADMYWSDLIEAVGLTDG